jgi:hypothetical protein
MNSFRRRKLVNALHNFASVPDRMKSRAQNYTLNNRKSIPVILYRFVIVLVDFWCDHFVQSWMIRVQNPPILFGDQEFYFAPCLNALTSQTFS